MTATKSFLRLTAAGVVAMALAGCESAQNNPKQSIGTLLGAGLGALAGSQPGGGKGQLAAVAVGALAGAWAGSEIGKSLDKADRMYAERTAQNGLEYNQTGQQVAWKNPDSGNSGTFTPTATYQLDNGTNCRDFETTIYVGGEKETGVGRACRRPDGTWQIVR